MKNKFYLSVLFMFFSGASFAEQNLPCEAVLCLSGGLASQSGFQECAPSIQAFGQIKIYSQKGFEPELTRAARTTFIESCKDADKNYIRSVLAMYGEREYIDIGL